ncbi:hypothetical protein NDU88_003383 [Pleurodeles waltl]|uniref:Uncharacterized protein n=1 Tax=Pleurodeles waltl TaxID=8319 RepID=A0AAV7W1Z9_PLEWA|nr:hypothetical protein NDU88_003383 [Pleurodeles waltl]
MPNEDAGSSEAAERPADCSQDDAEMKSLILAMKHSMTSMDAKMDTMCTRNDSMAQTGGSIMTRPPRGCPSTPDYHELLSLRHSI